jgi:hypothetical protein
MIFYGPKILKFFDHDPDPGSCQPWIWDEKDRIQDIKKTAVSNSGAGSLIKLLTSGGSQCRKIGSGPIFFAMTGTVHVNEFAAPS